MSTGSLRDAGLTVGQIRAAVYGGELLALRRDIVVASGIWSDASADGRVLLAARAALLVHPNGAVSHETAARLIGLPTQRKDPALDVQGIPIIHVTRPGHRRTGRRRGRTSRHRPSGDGRRSPAGPAADG